MSQDERDRPGEGWTRVDQSGPAWTSVDKSGRARTRVDQSGRTGTRVDQSGRAGTRMDGPGRSWRPAGTRPGRQAGPRERAGGTLGEERRGSQGPNRSGLPGADAMSIPEAAAGAEPSEARPGPSATGLGPGRRRTCAPPPPRPSQAPAGPAAWPRSSPRPPLPWPPPGPARSRRGPAAARALFAAGRGASTHQVRAASASGRGCGKMAAAVAAWALPVTFGRVVSACSRSIRRPPGPGAASLWSAPRRFRSQIASSPQGYVPKTSLSSPPWPETVLPEPAEETRHHAEVVGKVNELIATGQYGRLFAVVHFASHQWKVTSEDLILIENELDVACGERIRLEKVLLVGADNFTLLGKPLLGKDLVRVEATVIEKTESWPKINMKFKKRKNYRKKKIIVSPQTVLRINTIEIAPSLC
uniref:Large ribosomal subunit protein bL21m n=2 Tax=Equus caballus TaxID=9796 RepID=A0A9L0TPW3_HORSE